mmetsp:Transcript_53166/g.137505  ORF Transcript_53166/g.137505 Transcript_53166/m.137505 type:complete len:213 (-) Transcript_53166:56-694(-)
MSKQQHLQLRGDADIYVWELVVHKVRQLLEQDSLHVQQLRQPHQTAEILFADVTQAKPVVRPPGRSAEPQEKCDDLSGCFGQGDLLVQASICHHRPYQARGPQQFSSNLKDLSLGRLQLQDPVRRLSDVVLCPAPPRSRRNRRWHLAVVWCAPPLVGLRSTFVLPLEAAATSHSPPTCGGAHRPTRGGGHPPTRRVGHPLPTLNHPPKTEHP